MSREIIIGKEGTQPFAIKGDSVSRRHARLTETDNGQLVLEDLNSTNGTYVRDEKGQFRQIRKACVERDSVVRFGLAGVHSYTCWVNHLLVSDPTDYSYEFRRIMRLYDTEVRARQEQLWKRNDLREWACIAAPLVGLCLSFAFPDNPLMIRMSITIPTMAVSLFFMGMSRKMRMLARYRQSYVVCPCCGRPLSDHDLEQQQCSFCKAHS